MKFLEEYVKLLTLDGLSVRCQEVSSIDTENSASRDADIWGLSHAQDSIASRPGNSVIDFTVSCIETDLREH